MDAASGDQGYVQFVVPRPAFAESEILVGTTQVISGFGAGTEITFDELINDGNRQVVGLYVSREVGESGVCGCPITILGYQYYVEYALTLVG